MDRNFVFIFLFLTICFALSCGCFSGSDNGKLVSPATEVGTPVRGKVTTDIGPEGGLLDADDGRLTLRIPKNALSKTISFSIQAITNTAEGGTGNAYRLEPDNSTFNVPLELSMRYKDEDLQGTSLSAMSVAYQADGGEWRELKTKSIDEETGTITGLTTHFTDVTTLPVLRLSPDKATLKLGESIKIELKGCKPPTLFDRIMRLGDLSDTATCINPHAASHRIPWEADIGTVVNDANPTTYTAPRKKPPKKVATVSYVYTHGGFMDPKNGTIVRISAKINIVDRGYSAYAKKGDVVLTAIICSLDEPFTLHSAWLTPYEMKFDPAAGTWSFSTTWAMTTYSGSGTFKVEGADTDHPRLAVFGTETLTHPYGGITTQGGDNSIELTPLETAICD